MDWAVQLPVLDLSHTTDVWSIGPVIECEQRSQRAWRLQTAEGHSYYLKEHLDPQVLPASPVLRNLNAHGMRVEVPQLTLRRSVLFEQMGRYYALYRALPGVPLDFCGPMLLPSEIHAIATAIGNLHLALAACPEAMAAQLPCAELADDIVRCGNCLAAAGAGSDAPWLAAVVAKLRIVIGNLPRQLPMQLVHNDCHIRNIVFDESGVPGFVDFDFMRTNLRIFDPCYCVAGLLVDGLDRGLELGHWTALRDGLFAGYDALCHLEAAERGVIVYVIWAALLINAGWWFATGRRDLATANLRALQWLIEVGS